MIVCDWNLSPTLSASVECPKWTLWLYKRPIGLWLYKGPPIGVVGPSFFGIGELGPNQNAEFDVNVFPTHYVAGTVELMNVNLLFNNIVGERGTQLNQVYFKVTPSP